MCIWLNSREECKKGCRICRASSFPDMVTIFCSRAMKTDKGLLYYSDTACEMVFKKKDPCVDVPRWTDESVSSPSDPLGHHWAQLRGLEHFSWHRSPAQAVQLMCTTGTSKNLIRSLKQRRNSSLFSLRGQSISLNANIHGDDKGLGLFECACGWMCVWWYREKQEPSAMLHQPVSAAHSSTQRWATITCFVFANRH